MDLTCRLTPYYKLPSHTASIHITLPAIQSLSRITHPRLYPPKTLQTALASTHAYKPAHTLFPPFSSVRPLPLSLASHPSSAARSRPSSSPPRQLSSCLTASPSSAPYPRPLYLCTPAPNPMDGNQSMGAVPDVAASGSNRAALRAVVLLPPGTSTEYLPTCHHYMRTPRLALFLARTPASALTTVPAARYSALRASTRYSYAHGPSAWMGLGRTLRRRYPTAHSPLGLAPVASVAWR